MSKDIVKCPKCQGFLYIENDIEYDEIGTNLANDYYDFVRGADNEGRIGPRRVSQAGLISPIKVKQAMILSLGTAFLFGIYLVSNIL